MPTHQLGSIHGYTDKRRGFKDDFNERVVGGPIVFTTNAGGTTTTLVGANADPSTNTNVMRIGDRFKLFNSSNVLKQETVFTVTAVAVAGSTTVTFTPAAATATASGDRIREVGLGYSNSEKDSRLTTLGYTAARLALMTENDKDYALRTLDDGGSLP